MVSVYTWLNENSHLILNFLFIDCLYTSVKGKFSNNDIEVSSGQLKRFNQCVIDPKCLLKIAATSFFLTAICPFQATLYFLVYYYFYLRSTDYMFSKLP